MMRRIITVLILITAALTIGCNMDFAEDAFTVYEDDAEDLVLSWNADRSVLTASDPDSGETVWYETWEYVSGTSDPLLVRRYSPENRLKWSKLYNWTEGLKIQEVCYGPSDELIWFSDFTYDSGGNMLSESNYDGDSSLQWFNAWGYTGDLKNYQARYNSDSLMTAAYVWEYDGSSRMIKQTRYTGSASRNSAGLVYPSVGTPPSIPAFSTAGMTVSDWTMWSYDLYGSFKINFDSDNFPLLFYREDSRIANDISVEIDYYDGHRPKSKITRIGSRTALALELSYNADGYLSRIDTSGEALLIPLSYTIDYKADNSPEKVSVYQSDVLLMYFVYDAEPAPADQETHPLDPINFTGTVHSVTQYDGDHVKQGSYVFSFEAAENRTRIEVLDENDVSNGYFLANLNADSEVSSFEAWSAADELQWSYSYNYADIADKIMRTAEERFEVAGDISDYASIDIDTLSLDLLFN